MKPNDGFSTILFDLDGTLVDTVRTTAAAFSEIRRSRGFEAIGHEAIKPYVSRGGVELTRFALGEALLDAEADLRSFRQILTQLGPCHDEVYPGVREVLYTLVEQGFVLGVVTNKPQALSEQLLDGLDLATYFAIILGGDAVPRKKPDPVHIQVALRELEATPDDAIFIGDSEIDAEAAERSGVSFVHFSKGYCGPELLASSDYPKFSEYENLIPLLGTLQGWRTDIRVAL